MNSAQVDRLTEIASRGKEAAEKWLVLGPRPYLRATAIFAVRTLARMADLKGRRHIHFSDSGRV